MLLIVLSEVDESPWIDKLETGEAETPRTRFSLSNSTSITACFGLRCRLNVSLTYGISSNMIESDCDASARPPHQHHKSETRYNSNTTQKQNSPRCFAVMFFNPALRIAPAPKTTWHVLELNAFKNSITRLIVSVVSSDKFTTTRK